VIGLREPLTGSPLRGCGDLMAHTPDDGRERPASPGLGNVLSVGDPALRLALQAQDLADQSQRLIDDALVLAHEREDVAAHAQHLAEKRQRLAEERQRLAELVRQVAAEAQRVAEARQQHAADQHQGAAAELERQRARLTAILASMSDAVLVVDAAGTPVLTNAAFERFFNSGLTVTLEDEHGQPLAAEQMPSQRALRGESFTMQLIRVASDGARHVLEANGAPIMTNGVELWGVVVIRDITDRTLRRLQDEFLHMAGHELRTPLTPLRGYLDLLTHALTAGADSARTQHYVMHAVAETQRLQVLVNDLLDAGRLQTGKLNVHRAPVDLGSLAAHIIATAQIDAPGQPITLDAPTDPLVVNGDAARLGQVLLNLLTNALMYAPQSPRIDVRVRRDGHDAILEVQDYGPGIPAADLPHLFARFYQVARADYPSRQGLGLGLFIAHELVRAHDGRIDVRSTDGEGTTFILRLPVHAGR